MASSVRMGRAEAWRFLADAHTGILTTLRRDGMPVSLPVWFVVLDERVYVSGPARTKMFARVRADSRASFLVEDGRRWAELRGVHLTGRARIVDAPDLLARVHAALDAKYSAYRTPRAAMPQATRARYETETATIEVVADERILTWDNSRLDLGGEG
jgi:nitroimidazol reductase NimA-like FMN-containing flavoprotein (pyridoxamine 5'-phosphate oxidase superfamily)